MVRDKQEMRQLKNRAEQISTGNFSS